MLDQTPWERETIEKLLFETLKEQRRQRRWAGVSLRATQCDAMLREVFSDTVPLRPSGATAVRACTLSCAPGA